MDSQLLASAIADAKAVRSTALANAKAALEEAFAPQLNAMLSEKLREEIAGEDIPDDVAPSAEAPSEELPIDDFSTDTDADMGTEDLAPVGDDVAVDDVSVSDAPIGDEIEEDVLGQGNPDPVSQTAELTEETASSDYKKTTSGHKTQDPQGKNIVTKVDGTKGEPKEKSGSKTTIKRDVASFTNDPQGASNELSKGPSKSEKNATGKVLEEDEEIEEGGIDAILKELESEVSGLDSGLSTEPTVDDQDAELDAMGTTPTSGRSEEVDEVINLDELLSESDDEDDKEEENEEDEEKGEKKWNFQKENRILKTENKEYRKAIGFLRDRINEVNLLNAKLLYTNRIFKTASLNKSQKIKVIEQFDLTKSVREAKLTYVNLSESLSFGATKKVVVAAVAPVKKPVSTTVRAITEGLASKVVGSTKPTKPVAILTEGAEMANRFKKLAGIK